ncbi:MAG: hypothetical protein V7459_07845 [Oceanicoccus sp.]
MTQKTLGQLPNIRTTEISVVPEKHGKRQGNGAKNAPTSRE